MKYHMNGSMKPNTVSRVILLALMLGIFPSTLAILVPPPFIPRLQLHRVSLLNIVYPWIANSITMYNSLPFSVVNELLILL